MQMGKKAPRGPGLFRSPLELDLRSDANVGYPCAVGISVIGALASNLVQIVLARFLILGTGAWLIAPPFLAVGTVTSILLGLSSEAFQKRSRWYSAMKKDGGA